MLEILQKVKERMSRDEVKRGVSWRVGYEESTELFKKHQQVEDHDSTIVLTGTGTSIEYRNLRVELGNCTFIVAKNSKDIKEAVSDIEFAGVYPARVLYSHDCIELLKDINSEFEGCTISQIPYIFSTFSREYVGLYWAAIKLNTNISEDITFDLHKLNSQAVLNMKKNLSDLVDNGYSGVVVSETISDLNGVLESNELRKLVDKALTDDTQESYDEVVEFIDLSIEKLWNKEYL